MLVPPPFWKILAPVIVGAPVSEVSGSDASSHSMASIAAGIGANDYPLVLLSGRAAANRTLTSVTFGGVAGTILHSVDVDAGGNSTLLSFVVGPQGANGTVLATYSGALVRHAGACYAVRNVQSWAALDPTSTDTTSLNIDAPAGGVVFGVSYGNSTLGWTGLTEDWEQTVESSFMSGGFYQGAAEPNRAISCTGAIGIAAIGLA